MRKSKIKNLLLNSSSIKIFIQFLLIMICVKLIKDFSVYLLTQNDKLYRYVHLLDFVIFLILTMSFTYFFFKQKEKEEKVEKENNEKIRNMAYHCSLTGLKNRLCLNEDLSKIIDNHYNDGENLVVMFLDLDGFKKVNDNFGHNVGDILLKVVSKRLKNCVRENDLVCRVGGDEFVIVLRKVKNKNGIIVVADKIIRSISSPYVINGHNINISTSIGINERKIDKTFNIDDIIMKADKAMYDAKRSGKNKYCFYN